MIPPDHSDEQLAQRGADLVRAAAASVSAPPSLRERIERERDGARPAERRRRWQLGGAVACVLAAAVLVVTLVGTGAGTGGPTVVQAAELGLRPATSAAPARDPATRDDVNIHEGRVQFPYWGDTEWTPSGVRWDTIGDRHATTVFYDARGVRLAYTVVDAPALNTPAGRVVNERYTVFTHGDHTVVTWRAHGQTCIITAPKSVSSAHLVALAMLDVDVS